jgi:hypothetical protein
MKKVFVDYKNETEIENLQYGITKIILIKNLFLCFIQKK